jgi:hypothetical protein
MRTSLPAAVLLAFVCEASLAALIDRGTYTTDTASGLDWLDVTVTQGMAPIDVQGLLYPRWDDVLHQMVPSSWMGGGWRYALEADVDTLVIGNFGGAYSVFGYSSWPRIVYDGSSVEAASLDGLIQSLGLTYASPWGYSTIGWYRTGSGSSAVAILELEHEGAAHEARKYSSAYYSIYSTGSGTGSYLVRDRLSAVPLPATGWLLGTALVAACLRPGRRMRLARIK